MKNANASWAPEKIPTFWINHASRLILRRFEEQLRPLGCGFAYFPVVMALQEAGPLLQKDLVALSHVEQPTMTALLARMERDRVIHRTADPADGRAQRISLTAEAKKKLPKMKAAMMEVVERALDGLDAAERRTLMDLMKRVIENLGQSPEVDA